MGDLDLMDWGRGKEQEDRKGGAGGGGGGYNREGFWMG